MNKNWEEIIKSLEFIEKKPIKKDLKRLEFILIGEIKGRNVLLKISHKKNSYRIKQFEKEKFVDKIIEKHNKDISLPIINKTDFLASGSNKNYIWMVRKYYPGTSLATFDADKSLLGYDIIRRKYFFKKKEIINDIVKCLQAVYSLETDFRKLGIKLNDFKRRYHSNIEDYDIKAIEKELGIKLDNQIEFFNKIKKSYFEKENIKASVGDLSPANIIIKNDKEMVLSDFELFCFDNYTIDIAYLYIFLWRYDSWQKNLINLTIKNEQDRKFFQASIIRELLFLYRWPYASLKNKGKIDHREYNRKHIWRKYLEAAGDSFDAIMKVK